MCAKCSFHGLGAGEGGPEKGRGPLKLAPRERDAALSPRPWAGCGRGERAGYERRGGSVTGAPRECAGSVTEVWPRHEDRENSTLPPVLSNSDRRAACFDPPIGALKHAARYRPLISGPKRASEALQM